MNTFMNFLVILAIATITIALATTDTDISEFDAKLQNLDEKLQAQIKIIEDQIKHIDWYFDVGYNHPEKPIMDDVEEFVSNPINTFTMIKRTAIYFPKLMKHLFNETIAEKYEDIIKDVDELIALQDKEGKNSDTDKQQW